jgi:hypothetical protein
VTVLAPSPPSLRGDFLCVSWPLRIGPRFGELFSRFLRDDVAGAKVSQAGGSRLFPFSTFWPAAELPPEVPSSSARSRTAASTARSGAAGLPSASSCAPLSRLCLVKFFHHHRGQDCIFRNFSVQI